MWKLMICVSLGVPVRYATRAIFPACWLRLSGERRKKKADNENDREPDQPHGHLGGDGWRESSRRRLLAGAGRVGRARATR